LLVLLRNIGMLLHEFRLIGARAPIWWKKMCKYWEIRFIYCRYTTLMPYC